MLLEKIKEHAGKIAALIMASLVLISSGLSAKSIGMKSAEEKENPAENLSEQAALANAKNLEQALLENRQAKADAISNNPQEVPVTTQVEVTKTIPGATRKVPVTTYASSTSSKSSGSTTSSKSSPASTTYTSTAGSTSSSSSSSSSSKTTKTS